MSFTAPTLREKSTWTPKNCAPVDEKVGQLGLDTFAKQISNRRKKITVEPFSVLDGKKSVLIREVSLLITSEVDLYKKSMLLGPRKLS